MRKKGERRAQYHHKRKVHKIIRNKKKTYMKHAIELIEEDKTHNNTRKIY
jgi:hypothetical protein